MNLYRQLDRSRVQFDFALYEGSPCYYEEELETLGARVLRYPPPTATGLLSLRRVITRLMRDHGPYVAVHSQMSLFSGFPLAAAHRLGIPVRIAHSHTTAQEGADSRWRRLYRRHMAALVRKHATHIFGCSSAAVEVLLGAEAWSDPRMGVIPDAVDLESYRHCADEREGFRRQLGLPEEALVLGFVGRLIPLKNLFFVLKVFSTVRTVSAESHLLIAGEGALQLALERRAASLGLEDRVHFLGLRHDIPAIMSAVDALCLPSRREGLGMVLIEAQAAGTPCLCSEAIPEEADLGLGLVRRLPIDQGVGPWLEALSVVLKTPRPSWETRQERFAATGYDAASLARRMEAIYLGENVPR
jgi:glycosyltransferase involved in cell wall biosynthesis